MKGKNICQPTWEAPLVWPYVTEIKLTYLEEGRKRSSHVPSQEAYILHLIFNPSKIGRLFSGLGTTVWSPATPFPHCQLFIPSPFVLLSHWPSGLVLKSTKHTFPLPRTLLLQVVMYLSSSHASGLHTKKPSVITVHGTRPPAPSSSYSNPFPDLFFSVTAYYHVAYHIFLFARFFIVFLLSLEFKHCESRHQSILCPEISKVSRRVDIQQMVNKYILNKWKILYIDIINNILQMSKLNFRQVK